MRAPEPFCLTCGARVYRTHSCRPPRPLTEAQRKALADECRQEIAAGIARRDTPPQLDLFSDLS